MRTGGEKGRGPTLRNSAPPTPEGVVAEWLRPLPRSLSNQPRKSRVRGGRARRAGGRWRREGARSRRSRRGGPRGPDPRVRGTYRCGGRERGGGREGAGQSHWVPRLSLARTLSEEGNDGSGLSGRCAAGWWAWNPGRAARRAAVGYVILRSGLPAGEFLWPSLEK